MQLLLLILVIIPALLALFGSGVTVYLSSRIARLESTAPPVKTDDEQVGMVVRGANRGPMSFWLLNAGLLDLSKSSDEVKALYVQKFWWEKRIGIVMGLFFLTAAMYAVYTAF